MLLHIRSLILVAKARFLTLCQLEWKLLSPFLNLAIFDLPWSIFPQFKGIPFVDLRLFDICWTLIKLPKTLIYGSMMHTDLCKAQSLGDLLGLVSNMLADVVHPLLSFAFILCSMPFFFILSLLHRITTNAFRSAVLKRNSDVIMVGHQDALCLHRSSSNLAVLDCLLLLKGKADLAKLRKLIQERLVDARGEDGHLLLPKLTRYFKTTVGCSVWVKDEAFDIREHISKWTGQSPTTREELENLIGYLTSQTLPKNKSPWQIILIPSSSLLEKQCFVLFRFHHSITDNATFAEVILRQLADVRPATPCPKPSSGVTKKYMQALKIFSTGPALLLEKLSMPVEEHCLYNQALSGTKLATWSEQLDLALIKEMVKASKSSTGAVLMTCLSGALRDYFKEGAHKIPDDILVSVSFPSEITSESYFAFDRSTFVLLSLPLQLADPVRQLQAVKLRLETSMQSVEPTLNSLITSQFTGKMPLWLSSILNRTMADKCTSVLCEVSCPESKLFIGGSAVEDIIVWSGQQSSVGVGISIVSYNGQAKVTLMVDKAIMSDPAILLSNFEDHLEELAKMLNVL